MMGYLSQGKHLAFFIRLDDAMTTEANRLYSIFNRTKSKRVKTKIVKRIDALVECKD